MNPREHALEQIKRWEKAKEIKAQMIKRNAMSNKILREEVKDIELTIQMWKDTL